jgi:hypothetical protein
MGFERRPKDKGEDRVNFTDNSTIKKSVKEVSDFYNFDTGTHKFFAVGMYVCTRRHDHKFPRTLQ